LTKEVKGKNEMVQVADPYDWLAAKDLAEDS
jgi:hypothetical protein